MKERQKSPGKLRVLVYGAEARLKEVPEFIDGQRWRAEFGGLHTAPAFAEFDGVIFFHRCLEEFVRPQFGQGWLHRPDADEVDRRVNQVFEVISKGGFVCSVPVDPLDGPESNKSKDLLARILGKTNHLDSPQRLPGRCVADALGPFMARYGGTHTRWWYPRGEVVEIAKFSDSRLAAFAIGSGLFVIPAVPPTSAQIEHFFTQLLDGLVALRERIRQDLPNWIHQFRFHEEDKLNERRETLAAELASLDKRLSELGQLKAVLSQGDQALVESVAAVFNQTPLRATQDEQWREDLTLTAAGTKVALVEVKGADGVKREHINQTDSHRERSGFPHDFPALLVVNTAIKRQTIREKDVAVAAEQCLHAVKLNVLILRTLDLLHLVNHLTSGKLGPDDFQALLTTNSGWLRVDATGWSIERGAAPLRQGAR